MTNERTQEHSKLPVLVAHPIPDDLPKGQTAPEVAPAAGDAGKQDKAASPAGSTPTRSAGASSQPDNPQVSQADAKAAPQDDTGKTEPRLEPQAKAPPRKEVSETKLKMKNRLPALEDDADIGVEKEHVVTRDGKPDLAFIGTLRASAAPLTAPKGKWEEYRIYHTSGDKHVFSKVTRTVYAEDTDSHQAEVFDPSPPSVPAQIMRSAREIARSKALTWMDAAVAFFGYTPLAKALYRKLDVRFEEQIS